MSVVIPARVWLVAGAILLCAAAADDLVDVPADQVAAVLGIAVQADGAKEVGRIVDVLVDATGRPRAAIVDVGGFLGVGNRKVAVEWGALHFAPGKTPVATLAGAPDLLKSAPAYDPARPVKAVAPPPAAK